MLTTPRRVLGDSRGLAGVGGAGAAGGAGNGSSLAGGAGTGRAGGESGEDEGEGFDLDEVCGCLCGERVL